MSDETAFLSAIAATPDDDTARLAFADWLDDRDDFRGPFVRTAVAYDRTPPYDATRSELGARLRAMLDSPPFRAWLPDRPEFKWGWRRGLLALTADTNQLQGEDPAEIAEWMASLWIERAEFEGYTHGSIPDWEDPFGLVRNTREVHFASDNYGPDGLANLSAWPHLRALSLPYLGGGEAWGELAALPHLRDLTLDTPDWRMMPELHKARLPNLTVLDLDKEWEDDLPHWGTCFPNLRALTLTQYNVYPDEQCERFGECPELRHLALWQKSAPFTRVGLEALAKLAELRSLGLAKIPEESIAGLARLQKLEHLAAYGKSEPVHGLEELTQLRWLTLNLDTLTRAHAAHVIALPNLSRFEIQFKSFEPGALATLAGAPALQVLVVNPRDDKSLLSELTQLKQLRYLRIRYQRLTDDESRQLRVALPTCRIEDGPRDAAEDRYDWSRHG